MSPHIPVSGQKFGRLLALPNGAHRVFENGKKRLKWRCLCECGRELIVRLSSLRAGETKSCGCLAREVKAKRCHAWNVVANARPMVLEGL